MGSKSTYSFVLKIADESQSTPTSIVDGSSRLVAVLAGHPSDARWSQLHRQAAQALEERRSRCFIPKSKRKHWCGNFVVLQCGVSHGSGQTQPGNMVNHARNEQILKELNELEPFKRMAGFASGKRRLSLLLGKRTH